MRRVLVISLGLLLAGCALGRAQGSSEREWAHAECNRIIDREARERCMRRVDEDYGSRDDKEVKDPKARK